MPGPKEKRDTSNEVTKGTFLTRFDKKNLVVDMVWTLCYLVHVMRSWVIASALDRKDRGRAKREE